MKKNVYLIILTLVTVICIIGGTCYHLVDWGVSFLSHLPFASFYSDSDDTESSGTTLSTGTVSLPSFNTVKIDSKVMNLSIEKGDDYSIQCDSTEKLNPKYEIKDKTLIVSPENQSPQLHEHTKMQCSHYHSGRYDLRADQCGWSHRRYQFIKFRCYNFKNR